MVDTVNFQITDKCNSHCVMCNIWKRDTPHTMSVEAFKNIIADPAFKEVRHVGFSGGEPSLVENMPEYYQEMLPLLAQLRSISVITNCVDPKATVKLCTDLYKFHIQSGIQYSIMLSLDGIEDTHDRNRRVKGNFDSFMHVVRKLRSRSIEFSTGTTFTKENVWDAEKIISFLRCNGIYGRFRIAEFISRLSNDDCVRYIRCFTDDEAYQLKLFFTKLLHTYEPHDGVKNTYRNIIHMLSGGERITSCPYKNFSAINIDSHGNAAHCAPKGAPFSITGEGGFSAALVTSKPAFEEITARYCSSCIHDYHAPLTCNAASEIIEDNKWRSLFSVKRFDRRAIPVPLETQGSATDDAVFIIGWYGTETVGDKAILKGVVNYYAEKFPHLPVKIASLYPFITEKTIKELAIPAEVVNVYSRHFFECAAWSTVTVVGGGPLMELEELSLILWAFNYARIFRKQRHIHGCGIGPLHSPEKTAAVRTILELADEIRLRDGGSADFARKIGVTKEVEVIKDPSMAYVAEHRRTRSPKPVLACFLRELTPEYKATGTQADFLRFKTAFENAIAANIRELAHRYGLTPCLYAMHNFTVGNDDRDFNFYFAREYLSDIEHSVEKGLATVASICDAMQESSMNLCMRFHSVLFADALETEYLAIDYTFGGKIFFYLTEHGKENRLITADDLRASDSCLAQRCAFLRNKTP